jgi:hypothetical protein
MNIFFSQIILMIIHFIQCSFWTRSVVPLVNTERRKSARVGENNFLSKNKLRLNLRRQLTSVKTKNHPKKQTYILAKNCFFIIIYTFGTGTKYAEKMRKNLKKKEKALISSFLCICTVLC